ncbi:MAG: ImmA/IrrE family metallo-endopeptidase [Candidatus Thorarchaeota archaeon]
MVRGPQALANPVILKWAREDRGLDLDLAASRIGIKTSKLVACESGTDNLTFAQLRKAAYTYRRPTATFYLNDPPPPIKIPKFRRVPQRIGEPLSPELKLEIRKFHHKRRTAIELAEFSPSFEWTHLGSVGLESDPEIAGSQIRSMLGIRPEFPRKLDKYKAFNRWRNAIEGTGTLVFLISNVEVGEMRGLSFAESPFPFIAVNRKDDPRPRSFSLLHEFCHLLLKDSSVCEMRSEFEVDKAPSKSPEVFCNHAAGAALVPADLLLMTSTVRMHGKADKWALPELTTLARRFRVSREVILRRLLILDKTSGDFYRRVRDHLQYTRPVAKKGGGGEFAYQRVMHTDGLAFTSMVIDALDGRAITYSDVTDILGIRLNDLDPLRELIDKKRR